MHWYKVATATAESLFDVTSTGTPYYDDMLNDPEYFKERKGKVFEIAYMSPDDYISEISRGFWHEPSMQTEYKTYDNFLQTGMKYRIGDERLQELFNSQQRFPLPYIEYDKNGNMLGQEGHHRAMVAKLKGLPKMPVMIIRNIR